ncbi:MAG: Quaternary ammonium compound-resistance protein SugE [uncultured Thermomicrobiales bacterium]|uniref:Guanidinium exporter n=1 Tax=uncultured Thermomicrobiales bacterium TaxID=1645740 RepID=A0A6J4UUG7_9BACT|nr:MAG: Quaternary ammonium compound-resistance protein SugE [uncultured Thermomicrobiales bacterium]
MIAWSLVVVAGLFEIAFATALKASANFTRVVPTITFIVCSVISLGLLSVAVRSLPIGSAYAVWTGVGAAGTALIGMFVLGEPKRAIRILSIAAIVVGVVGLQLTGSGH